MSRCNLGESRKSTAYVGVEEVFHGLVRFKRCLCRHRCAIYLNVILLPQYESKPTLLWLVVVTSSRHHVAKNTKISTKIASFRVNWYFFRVAVQEQDGGDGDGGDWRRDGED